MPYFSQLALSGRQMPLAKWRLYDAYHDTVKADAMMTTFYHA